MTDYEAVEIAGGWGAGENATEEELLAAYDHLVKTGLAWRLEGSIGRTAAALIREGLIDPPTGGKDFWGNYLPARREDY